MDLEEQAGFRFAWTIWPSSREHQTLVEAPLGCLYTPLKDIQDLQVLDAEPLRSKPNGPIINPYCLYEHMDKSWRCPFTHQNVRFPESYANTTISQNNLYQFVYPTIEYQLPKEKHYRPDINSGMMGGYKQTHEPTHTPTSPTFLFVIDTCVDDDQLRVIIDCIQQALSLMPPDSSVGLITYGKMCCVHEIGFKEIQKLYVFQGEKDIQEHDIQQQLGLAGRNDPRGVASYKAMRRFLLPVKECMTEMSTILEELQRDNWPTPHSHRPSRCTGVALSVAIALLGCCCPQQAARLILFVGGACTTGPGQIVDTPRSQSIRQYQDIKNDGQDARFVNKALKFYTQCALRANEYGHCIDLCCGSLDQFGLYEMRVCSEKTGGYTIMSDSFDMDIFKGSYRKIFEVDDHNYLKHGYNAIIQVFTSDEFRIRGAIGCCTSTHKKDNHVSDEPIGEGGTYEWRVGALDRQSTLAFYFEIKTPTISNNNTHSYPRQSYLQVHTYYQHPNGHRHLRVSTLSFNYSGPSYIKDMTPAFDQEAAAVLLCREAVLKTETENEETRVLGMLDRKLIRLTSRFAEYSKGVKESFRLPQEFSIFPQFMYNLRRSNLIRTFNSSPDEITYYRTILMRENCNNSIMMIQPSLMAYTFDNLHANPVFLDATSLKPDAILLLDTFFHVVIWHGENIDQWIASGYHLQSAYTHFNQLLERSEKDAIEIMSKRFPVPKFVKTKSGGSQARFLTNRVNPSITYKSTLGDDFDVGSSINSDDVSLGTFIDHLIKFAIQS